MNSDITTVPNVDCMKQQLISAFIVALFLDFLEKSDEQGINETFELFFLCV